MTAVYGTPQVWELLKQKSMNSARHYLYEQSRLEYMKAKKKKKEKKTKKKHKRFELEKITQLT